MNKLLAVGLLSLSAPLLANCGNGPAGAGNGCNGGGTTNVTNITNVTNNTTNVTNTGTVNNLSSPLDPRMTETRFGVDTALRIYDGKRVQLQAYNIFSPSMHDKEDLVGDGRNLQYGIRFVFKLGSSYEERLLEKQARGIKALEAALSRLQ